ncbi:MAG: rhodanese-like domain-containing protein [Planctomycetes bacterium]|nr:rhodanese-like domain-containing protein [Planctomycetota bacterium]
MLIPWVAAPGVAIAIATISGARHRGEAQVAGVYAWPADARAIIDVRPRAAYDQGHVPGAISLAFRDGRFEANPFTMTTSPPTGTIVVYCSNEDCGDARLAAASLSAALGQPIAVYLPGYAAWKAAAKP